jgi:hypothetical protein
MGSLSCANKRTGKQKIRNASIRIAAKIDKSMITSICILLYYYNLNQSIITLIEVIRLMIALKNGYWQ